MRGKLLSIFSGLGSRMGSAFSGMGRMFGGGAGGAGNAAAGSPFAGLGRMFGFGGGAAPGSRFAGLRKMAGAKRFFGGMLARGAFQGGAGGAASRLGLGLMAAGRRRGKRGGKSSIPPSVIGFLSRDVLGLASSLRSVSGALQNTVAAMSSGKGLGMLNPTIANSQAMLEHGRAERAFDFAKNTSGTQAFKNSAQSFNERIQAPIDQALQNIRNVLSGIGNIAGGILKAPFAMAAGPFANPSSPAAFAFGTPEERDKLFRKEFPGMYKLAGQRFPPGPGQQQQDPTKMRDDWWNMSVPKDHGGLYGTIISEMARGKHHSIHQDLLHLTRQRKPPLPSLSQHLSMRGRAW